MSAVGYIRISKKDQSVHSIAYQEKNIRDYCEFNSVKLSSIFVDDGASSYTFDRPDYKALERFLHDHKGNVKFLVVLDHDRFSRNLPEARKNRSTAKEIRHYGGVYQRTIGYRYN